MRLWILPQKQQVLHWSFVRQPWPEMWWWADASRAQSAECTPTGHSWRMKLGTRKQRIAEHIHHSYKRTYLQFRWPELTYDFLNLCIYVFFYSNPNLACNSTHFQWNDGRRFWGRTNYGWDSLFNTIVAFAVLWLLEVSFKDDLRSHFWNMKLFLIFKLIIKTLFCTFLLPFLQLLQQVWSSVCQL